MINHARTLLLNQPRRKTHYSDIGYEYVPADYRPVELPPTLSVVRNLFFGAAPDNYFLNYRCRELLAYLHTTELSEYVYALDPRVTYWPELNKPFLEPTSRRVSITQTYGAPKRFTITGNLRALNSLGHAYNQYTIDLYREETVGDEIVLKLKLQPVGRNSPAIVTEVASPSSPPILTLPGTEVKLRLATKTYAPDNTFNDYPAQNSVQTENGALLVVETYTPANGGYIYLETPEESENDQPGKVSRWFVETKATPEPILQTALSALELIGEPAIIELFGVENKEPYLTFKNLWLDHPLPIYRLSGIVLALIYRTEELRG